MFTHKFGLLVILAIGTALANYSNAAEKSPASSASAGESKNVKNQKATATHRDLTRSRTVPLPQNTTTRTENAVNNPIGNDVNGAIADRDRLMIQNQARAARELQQFQKIQEAQRALQPGFGAQTQNNGIGMDNMSGDSLRDRAAGRRSTGTTGPEGRVGGGSGGGGNMTMTTPGKQAGPQDYRTSMRDNASTNGSGRFSAQPSSPGSDANIPGAGFASWGPVGSKSNGKSNGESKSGSSRTTTVDSNGNKYTVITTQEKGGSSRTVATTTRSDGATRNYDTTTKSDGSSRTVMVERDNKGNVVDKQTTERDPEGNVVHRSGSDTEGQPAVHDGAVSGGGCNWNPVWGKCMGSKGVTPSEMTSQPSRGEGDAGSGNRASPHLGAEAVTNSGDAGWAVQRQTSGGGRPRDMRDPTRGDDGNPAPPVGGFAPR